MTRTATIDSTCYKQDAAGDDLAHDCPLQGHFTGQAIILRKHEHGLLPKAYLYGKDRKLPSRKGGHKGCQTLRSLEADQNERTPASGTAENTMQSELL